MKQLFHTQVYTSCIKGGRIHFRSEKMDKNIVPSNGRSGVYDFMRMLFLFGVVFFTKSLATAQLITGATSVCVGSTTPLTDAVTGGTWSSSDVTVATVDISSGVVTGIASGTATISYTVSGVPTTSPMTVNALPSAGTVSGPNQVCILSAVTLTSSISGGSWSSTYGIATVGSASGIMTGVAIGADFIKYCVTNGCGSATATVSVSVNGIVGDIYTDGGTGAAGYGGDNGPAFMASMSNPRDLVADSAGNVYFCDVLNNRVRKISNTGIITTIAGNGVAGNSGDGGPATAAELNGPNGVFLDNSGNIFISNTSSNTIRKVSPSGIITAIAGVAGASGSSGDGGPATLAKFNLPLGILEDAAGDIYIADQNNNKVRKITTSTGIINTVVGTGTAGYSGDNGPAVSAKLNTVRGLASDNLGNIYIADALNNVIRKYVPSTGIITTFAGTGVAGHTGDNGPATAATLTSPARFAYDGANILYITDQSNHVIREVNLATGIISQVAGNTIAGFSGDFGVANSGELHTPAGIAVDHLGNFYIADANNNRVRVVPSTGSISSNITGPTNVCAGTPITLNAFLSGSGVVTYQWQRNGFNIGTGGTTYTNPAPSDGDVYRVIVSVVSACSTSFNDTSNNINIIVGAKVSNISGATGLCSGSTAVLVDSAVGGTWTSSASTVATITSGGTLSGITSGTSIISYSLPNACGVNAATMTVTITALDTINATAGANGTIAPIGPVSLCGGTQTYTITPNPGYHIADVLVDGSSVGAVATFTFSAISGNHTISASTFAPDCVAPSITCSGDITQNADSAVCGAVVTYGAATATGTSPTITYSQNSGTVFPVGTTMVIATASNACGTDNCSMYVTVLDNEYPTITTPADITVNADAGLCSASSVVLGTPITADNCGVASVTNDGVSPYPVGTTEVTWTVTDIHGNVTTASQYVTVIDNQAPSVTAPGDVTVNADAGLCSAAGVSLGTPVATDNCGIASVTNDATPPYPVGATVVTWTVTDIHGNTATATQNVTVIDNQAPTITAPADMTVNADAGLCSAAVSIGSPVTFDNCGIASVTNDAVPPFPVGTTTVTWTVTDIHGNTATSTQNITVVDNQNPVITAPPTVTINADPGLCSAAYTFLGTPVATDNCGVAIVSNNAMPPYPVGTTVVTWTAIDIHGNMTTTTQNVVVVDNQAPTIAAPADVTVNADSGACSAATVSLGSPVTGDNCGVATVTNDAKPPFAVGTTVVTWTVTDVHGNTSTATQNVTVIDNQNPTIIAPHDIFMNGYCSPVSVSLGTPTTADNCGVASVTNDAPALFPVGVTVVTWTVTDVHGNTATAKQSVTVTGSMTISATTVNVSCNGSNDGSITTTITGGTPSYAYLWSNGATSSNISSLPAGTYSVAVTDAHDCRAVGTYIITQPAALSLAGAVVVNVTCHGMNNGSITTNVTGGTTAYSYIWSTGSTSANLTALAPGTYSVTVTDAHGCKVTGTYTITQPATGLSLSAVTTNAGCHGATGSVTTTVTGGTLPYTYAWSNGATTSSITAGAGTYSVTVTDAHGCSVSGSYTITAPASGIAFSTDIDNVNCHGGFDGHIDADVSGGTWPYTYSFKPAGVGFSFYDDLYFIPAGTYTVTVTDAAGCTATASYTVTEPAPLVVTSVNTNVSCYGGSNGSINTTVTGGTAPYYYWWSDGSHAADRTGLWAGTYSLVVVDAHGCSTTASYTILQPAAITITAVTSNVSCHGGSDGSINTTVVGGTAPYTYLWSNGSKLADPTGLAAGTYVVTVTDANGCSKTVSYSITQPPAMTVTATVKDLKTCTDKIGSMINPTVSGGTPGYTYLWNTGVTTANLHDVLAGTYTVTVTDAHGCKVSGAFTVTCPDDDNGHDHHAARNSNPNDTGSSENPMGAVTSNDIKVYPNPTQGILNVQIPAVYKNVQIQISDVTGRIIETRNVADNNGDAVQFTLANLVEGMYYIKVQADDNTYVDKVLKR